MYAYDGKSYDQKTGSIHLQSVGRHQAKPAEDLEVGEFTVWNWGGTMRIVSLEHRGKSVYSVLRDRKTGKDYPRRFLRGRMVAYVTAERMEKMQAIVDRIKSA